MSSRTLQIFPHLSEDEFGAACRAVEALWRSLDEDHDPSRQIRVHCVHEANVLIIEKVVAAKEKSILENVGAEEGEGEGLGLEDDQDDEALIRIAKPCQLDVEFNVLLSATYQVPVLWFVLRNLPAEGPKGVDAVYHYLVPERYRAELRQFGVIGGISMGYHPLTDIPSYFVHPCNTADAMREVAEGRLLTPMEYLLTWLGLVGGCVDLHVPSELLVDQPKQKA